MYIHYRKPPDTQLLRDILEEYVKYGYLQSNFLYALMEGKAGRTYVIRKQQAMREKYGLLFRPKEQTTADDNHYAFQIHALTDRGKDLVKKLDINPPIVASIKRRGPDEKRGEEVETDVKDQDFWHAVGISNTLVSIELATRRHGIKFISEGEIKESYKKETGRDINFYLPFNIVHNGQPISSSRRGDFLFGLTYEDGLTSYFLGEHERENSVYNPKLTRDRSSWEGKDVAYRDILNKKTYKDHLGIPNLHILVTAKTEYKSQQQRELSESLGKNKYFLFTHVPDQYTTGKSPVPYPEILTNLWQRPGCEPIAIYTKPQQLL